MPELISIICLEIKLWNNQILGGCMVVMMAFMLLRLLIMPLAFAFHDDADKGQFYDQNLVQNHFLIVD